MTELRNTITCLKNILNKENERKRTLRELQFHHEGTEDEFGSHGL